MRLPFGTWPSPLTPDVIASANLRVGFPTAGADGAWYWTEARPERGGRTTLVREAHGLRTDVGSADLDVRSKVHEYGGRPFGVDAHGRVVLSDATDGRLHLVEPDGRSRPLTQGTSWRFAQPVFDLAHRRILAVGERHGTGARFPDNLIVAVDLDTGAVRPLVEGRDFYAELTLSRDGRLAFLAWDHPHMPWDAAEAWVGELGSQGEVRSLRPVAGRDGAAAFQPTFAPDGRVYVSVETNDRFRVHRVEPDGSLVCVIRTDAELFLPLWMIGTEVFAFRDAHRVVCCGMIEGRSVLLHADVDSGEVTTLDDTQGFIGHVACRGDEVLFLRGWSAYAMRYDLRTQEATTHRGPPQVLDDIDVSVGELVRFPTTGGDQAYGFFYEPRHHGIAGPAGERPPLMVVVHGGPTGCASPTLQLAIQVWTTRGFAVLDVDYRGSTGFGRTYRERLRGRWGVVDVDDCVEGARAMVTEGRVDADRLAIRGGSAGGYTVLRALSLHRLFRSGACHYGISDLEALVHNGHKFEATYDRMLVGPYPEARATFVERSPIHHPERITAPVIFFQGLDDRAVPPEQTRAVHDAMAARGLDTEYHAYEGEGHGFRKPENVRHALETELAFHRRVLRLG
jgi:dipeptidyl aminopeptidase/acylaminoacyl peptidase